MKHKHAELIKAWANGAEIQSRNDISGCWEDNRLPMWAHDTMYRIKPEQPVVRWLWAFVRQDGWRTTVNFYTEKEAKQHINSHHIIKLEYTRQEFPE
jgi:hypothetical protein